MAKFNIVLASCNVPDMPACLSLLACRWCSLCSRVQLAPAANHNVRRADLYLGTHVESMSSSSWTLCSLKFAIAKPSHLLHGALTWTFSPASIYTPLTTAMKLLKLLLYVAAKLPLISLYWAIYFGLHLWVSYSSQVSLQTSPFSTSDPLYYPALPSRASLLYLCTDPTQVVIFLTLLCTTSVAFMAICFCFLNNYGRLLLQYTIVLNSQSSTMLGLHFCRHGLCELLIFLSECCCKAFLSPTQPLFHFFVYL